MTRLLDVATSYDAVLLDAYGVLVDTSGAIAGAPEAVRELEAAGVPYLVVTNDASRLPETIAARLGAFGFRVQAEQIVTSGSLLGGWFAMHRLAGARCFVLGPDDARRYVERAGGRVVPVDADADADVEVVVAGDEDGFDFLPTLDATLSAVIRAVNAGCPPALVQPNPDLIYPAAPGRYGFTIGAATLALEAALERRHPGRGLRFERLGKPNPQLFAEAVRRAGSRRLLMVGDQLETDIAGARRFGLDAALVATGITRAEDAARDHAIAPTWILDRL